MKPIAKVCFQACVLTAFSAYGYGLCFARTGAQSFGQFDEMQSKISDRLEVLQMMIAPLQETLEDFNSSVETLSTRLNTIIKSCDRTWRCSRSRCAC